MENIQLIVPALISCVFGIITAFITTSYKLKKQHKIEREKEKDRIRLKYLNPLLVASKDLLERTIDIKRRRMNEEEKNKMIQWFKKIKTNERGDKQSFEYWANDEGYFAMSSLYVTAVYFCYASKIRREFPFIELRPGDDKALLHHISEVRTAIGGKYGIWETIQDSLGSYLINEDDDTVKNYREFCDFILDRSEFVWFNRLIDFYRDIHKKLEDHIENIELSLKALIEFLNTNLDIKRTEFKLTEQSLKELKGKNVPKNIVTKLEDLKGKVYKNEIDFIDALASKIPQDQINDYKSAILRHAILK